MKSISYGFEIDKQIIQQVLFQWMQNEKDRPYRFHAPREVTHSKPVTPYHRQNILICAIIHIGSKGFQKYINGEENFT